MITHIEKLERIKWLKEEISSLLAITNKNKVKDIKPFKDGFFATDKDIQNIFLLKAYKLQLNTLLESIN